MAYTKTGAARKGENMCWSCVRALPGRGCRWADSFKPVPGWNAEKTEKRDANNRIITSYHISDCPLYLEGRYLEKWQVDDKWTEDIQKAIALGVSELELNKLKEMSNPKAREEFLRRYL